MERCHKTSFKDVGSNTDQLDFYHNSLTSSVEKFLIVAIDYFTKWIEAEPFVKINERNAINFVWKNIVCWFGILKVIISDNTK